MEPMPPRTLGPNDGVTVDLGSLGVWFIVWSEQSGGGFSLVEHPIPPRTLAAPLYRHANEDQYSYVLEGRMGAQLGPEVVYAEQGDLVFKPRHQWHTFWNAGQGPCRILKIISPGGFERLFAEAAGETARTSMPSMGSISTKWSDCAKSTGSPFRPGDEVTQPGS
jgi:mannose-6-phosphate isomerase-like protein (cupin superfamily)